MFKFCCLKKTEHKIKTAVKTMLAFVFIIISVIINSSCNIFDSSQENLILRPLPSDMEAMIKNKMAEVGSSDLSFVYSSRGKYQNSINYVDLDGDGLDEIIVTYRSALAHPQSGNSANICVFKQINGELVLYFDIVGSGTEIDKIDFCDFNNDGFMEIVAGYISSQNGNRKFSIYYLDYINKRYTDELPITYTDWIITDIANKEAKSLVFVNYDSLSSYAFARLVRYDPVTRKIKTFKGEDTLVYSPNYYRMFEGKTADGRNAIYISTKRGSLLSSTEILLWDENENQIVNVSCIEQAGEFKLKDGYTSYGTYLAQDIDKDGIIEIPICDELDEKKILETQKGQELLVYRYDWYKYDNGLKKDYTSYINEKQSYIFKIKDEWEFDEIKGYINYKNDLMFFYVEEGVGAPSHGIDNRKYLFTIKQTSEEPENKELELKYIKETGIYYILDINVLIKEELKYLVPSKDELQSALHFTNIIKANTKDN